MNADAPEPVCKVEGCSNRVFKSKGRYGGLCIVHRDERIEAAKAKPNNSKPAYDERDVHALLNDDELDLDGVRLDAARILLREPS